MESPSSTPPSSRFVGDMDWPRFTVGFIGLIVTMCGASAALSSYAGVDYTVAVGGVSGLLFLAAAAVAPRGYLFRVVRNTGWFSAIEDDRHMRWVLVVLAAGLVAWYIWGTLH